jgi:uncharacterized protein (TIGR02271 family)
VNGSEKGGGERRPRSRSSDDATVVRHEEQAQVVKQSEHIGSVRARREVVRERVREEHPRKRQELATERVPVGEGDSGKIETLPDGSISIPLFEERLVVTRQTVLRERVIIRKEDVTDWQTVEAELRRERVRFETDDLVDGAEETKGLAPGRGRGTERGAGRTRRGAHSQARLEARGGGARRRRATAEPAKEELYQQAKQLGIEGRSKMSKAELARAVGQRRGRSTGGGRAKAKANPVSVQAFLEGVGYPMRKGQLLREAESQGAGREVRATLRRLPDKNFASPTEVSEAIGRLG